MVISPNPATLERGSARKQLPTDDESLTDGSGFSLYSPRLEDLA